MQKLISDENADPSVCKFCGNARKPTAKTGRPRRYCNPSCRQVANWKIKRLQKRIEGCEFRLDQVQTDPKWAVFIDVEFEKAELARLKCELAALVAD